MSLFHICYLDGWYWNDISFVSCVKKINQEEKKIKLSIAHQRDNLDIYFLVFKTPLSCIISSALFNRLAPKCCCAYSVCNRLMFLLLYPWRPELVFIIQASSSRAGLRFEAECTIDRSDPWFVLKPLKVEYLHKDPALIVYHSVIPPNVCKDIVDLSQIQQVRGRDEESLLNRSYPIISRVNA